jgi:hypothetical protein
MTRVPEDRVDLPELLRHKNVGWCTQNIGLEKLPNQGSILVATGVIKVTYQVHN